MATRRSVAGKAVSAPYLLFTRPEGSIGCPIRASMGVLGHKWALVILRDVAFLPEPTFGIILHRNLGLTPRILSSRLNELRAGRLIEKVAHATDNRVFYYRLTERGRGTVPVLAALMDFGMKHFPELVFDNGKPKSMAEVYPGLAARFLGDLYEYAVADFQTGRRPPKGLLLTRATAPKSGVAIQVPAKLGRRGKRGTHHYVVRPTPSG